MRTATMLKLLYLYLLSWVDLSSDSKRERSSPRTGVLRRPLGDDALRRILAALLALAHVLLVTPVQVPAARILRAHPGRGSARKYSFDRFFT